MKFDKYTTDTPLHSSNLGTTIELLVLGTTLNVWLIIFLKPNEKPKRKKISYFTPQSKI